jgi:AraC-like DNA-binding protein
MNLATTVEQHAETRYTIAQAGQRFVGRVLESDPAAFLRGVRLLARDVPTPESMLESEDLRKELAGLALKGAVHLHGHYHRTVAQYCAGSPNLETITVLLNRDADPRCALRNWTRQFLHDFAATHPWPVAVRGAMILRKQRRRPLSLNALCVKIGTSRSALTRSFRQQYGFSVAEYHRRARLQWVCEELRLPASNTESVALRAGFKSLSSLCQCLCAQTGLTPTQVRRLSYDGCRDLLESTLSLRSVQYLRDTALALWFVAELI